MNESSLRWYKTKIDWWIPIVLTLPPIAAVSVTLSAILAGNREEIIIGIGAILFVSLLYFGLIIPIRYGLDAKELIVQAGLCRFRIPLSEIEEVYPTHNPLSSPAMSLDRLGVRFGKGLFKRVLISPAEREEFLDHLARNASMTRDGKRLRRGPTFDS